MSKRIRKIVSIGIMTALIMLFAAVPAQAADAQGTTIYGDTTDDHCFYERMVELPNGDLLATWQREFPLVTSWTGMKSFYFYKSSDRGKTWSYVSELDPSDFGLSRDKQGMPGLFVLPQTMGSYSAGTILFATSDWDSNATYTIHIWRSTDNGATWTLHSNMAARGGATRSVWEPEFAVSSDDKLVCYYSDERQAGYDQCIALETSSDGGVTWGNYSIIAGEYEQGWEVGDPSLWRPGMPRVMKLKDGTYFMAYENIHGGLDGIVSCRTSNDGINWGNVSTVGTTVTASGTEAHQCPAIAWIDDGSTYGRIFLRGMNDTCSGSLCYTSTDKGQTWQLIDAPLTAVRKESVASGWSGAFVVVDNTLVELNNYCNGTYNEVRCGTGNLYGDQLIVSGADYKIVNAANGYCLDDAGGSLEWGNEMILWTDNGLHTQSWHTENISSDWHTLICNFSDLALDNPNSSQTSGTRIVQWDVNQSSAQQWKFIPDGNGYYKIQNAASSLYLDTENQSTALEANVIQSTENASSTQKWTVERIYEIARFRSYNISDCHVYHTGSNSVIIDNPSTSLPPLSSEWRVVPGLADDSHISLESVDSPGYYLRHYNGNVIISQYADTAIFRSDATWRVRTGLASADGISLETYNFDDIYMRHYNGNLIISQISTQLDREDATFCPTYQ